MKYFIYRNEAFGDTLLAAMLVAILHDQGIDVVFWDNREWMRALVDVPLWDGQEQRLGWNFKYTPESRWDGRSIMVKAMQNFCKWSGYTDLQLTRRVVPVKYHDEPDIIPTTISICSVSGEHTPYRNWPYFSELKRLLDFERIRWVDVSDLRGNLCLNQVKKSAIYLGLETGMSHYVSSVVVNGLIIQSGYSNINYWSMYSYQTIEKEMPCQNCFLRNGCAHEHHYMRGISSEAVFDHIRMMLRQAR